MVNSDIQVKTEHYDFSKYVTEKRWMSYYNQIVECCSCAQKSDKILIIGQGDGIVGIILRNMGFIVTTFDFDNSLNPSICGDVREIDKIVDEKYDVVICCQVLEHIPYEYFSETIKAISRICNKAFVISLPYRSIRIESSIRFPMLKEHSCNIVIPRFWEKNVPWKGQHYWEIGTKNKQRRVIKAVLHNYFSNCEDYIYKKNPYHWFCVCIK